MRNFRLGTTGHLCFHLELACSRMPGSSSNPGALALRDLALTRVARGRRWARRAAEMLPAAFGALQLRWPRKVAEPEWDRQLKLPCLRRLLRQCRRREA